MKQQAIKYGALDVHRATLVVNVRDEQGSVVMRATVPTEAKVILGLIRGLGARVHIAFEKGTQAQWLHDVLTPHVERGRRNGQQGTIASTPIASRSCYDSERSSPCITEPARCSRSRSWSGATSTWSKTVPE